MNERHLTQAVCSNKWSHESGLSIHLFLMENICCFGQGDGHGGCLHRDWGGSIHMVQEANPDLSLLLGGERSSWTQRVSGK